MNSFICQRPSVVLFNNPWAKAKQHRLKCSNLCQVSNFRKSVRRQTRTRTVLIASCSLQWSFFVGTVSALWIDNTYFFQGIASASTLIWLVKNLYSITWGSVWLISMAPSLDLESRLIDCSKVMSVEIFENGWFLRLTEWFPSTNSVYTRLGDAWS